LIHNTSDELTCALMGDEFFHPSPISIVASPGRPLTVQYPGSGIQHPTSYACYGSLHPLLRVEPSFRPMFTAFVEWEQAVASPLPSKNRT